MPKRSKAETKQTVEQILLEAQRQILHMGYDVMSYSSLADATGISRTGISHHFPHKSDFLLQLEPEFATLLIAELDFSDLKALQLSWNRALQSVTFSGIVKLVFSICGSNQLTSCSFTTLSVLKAKVAQHLGHEGVLLINHLLGHSAMVLFSQVEQSNPQRVLTNVAV